MHDGRMFSDFFRFIVLYKFGGSYTDTDNICFKKFPTLKNIICRTYDSHTAFYDKITDENCISGIYKYNNKFTDINFAVRNDCWLNFDDNYYFDLLLNSDKLISIDNKVLYINHENGSWQGLLLTSIRDNIKELIKRNYIFGLNLIYLYEKFIAASSVWDTCQNGGEMCSLYDNLPEIKKYDWGEYLTTEKISLEFLDKVKNYFPTSCFLWMGDKEGNKELFNNNNRNNKRISSWIYLYVKNKINYL